MLQVVAFLIVCMGAVLMVASLGSARQICLEEKIGGRGWQFLGVLIVFFVIGYALFCVYLFNHPVSTIESTVAAVFFGGGLFVYLVVRSTLFSIAHVRQLAEKERHRALHDELTDLPNRSLLEDRVDQAILMAKRRREPVAALFMDLNDFKQINDALGHFYGDYLLQQVAHRFRGAVRAADTLARLGGDEFALVLPGAGLAEAKKIAQKLAASLEEPFLIEGHHLSVGVSTGIAIYPEHGEVSENLLQSADSAMYTAKRHQILYAVYNPEEDRASMNRLILIGQLRNAISNDQLVLHYQPKISLSNGKFCGVEALVRWQHPEQGMIPPNNFIPLAEQAGLIRQLSAWVLARALEQHAEWRENGLCIPVSVNLSIKNLQDTEFPSRIEELLRKWRMEPKLLTLEITESSMMTDPNRVKKVIGLLSELGIKMSIDDFGTGYSSLAYLCRFPAMEIKIDKSFITDMLRNEDNAVIVRSTIDMIHNIGREVVAEGVEDEATMKLLKKLGCDCLQGFHISRPLSSEQLHSWLRETNWHHDRDYVKPRLVAVQGPLLSNVPLKL